MLAGLQPLGGGCVRGVSPLPSKARKLWTFFELKKLICLYVKTKQYTSKRAPNVNIIPKNVFILSMFSSFSS